MSRRGSDQYVTITAILAERRDKSIRLNRDDWDETKWVPRGWIEKTDDFHLTKAEVGAQISVRVLGDRAVEKGLL